MKSLVITDTIAPTEAVARPRPTSASCPTAPIFAQAILNIWNGTSVSSLFDGPTLRGADLRRVARGQNRIFKMTTSS
jgi:ribose-phosphate pyrophosphokinase